MNDCGEVYFALNHNNICIKNAVRIANVLYEFIGHFPYYYFDMCFPQRLNVLMTILITV